MVADYKCPSCDSVEISKIFELDEAPVHSVLLLPTREQALNYPRGKIALGFCQSCGFITNLAFDPDLHDYSSEYEATQAYSPTFNEFHHRLAVRLIEKYGLHHKDIIEIGCGQGEFLILLCELGDNRGVGFDPAYRKDQIEIKAADNIVFVNDFYSEKYAHYRGDFVCCKMTLEHIQHTADFVGTVRRSVGDRDDTVVFFQVPNVRYVLNEVAFWDIYYEHCSYFSAGSLARLFRRSGFEILGLSTDYNDQYLMIEARPDSDEQPVYLDEENDLAALKREVAHFVENYRRKITGWQKELQNIRRNGQRIVIWGGGSKGVAFLTTLKLRQDDIEYVVDINPTKHGTFMAGTGQEIVGPDFLKDYHPDVVIAMNPIYCDEIQQALSRLGITARLMPL